MGNTNTKESRGDDSGRRGLHSALDVGLGSSTQSGRESSRRNRNTRHDLSGLLGRAAGGSSSHADERHERKETKQEREARRLEKERVARLQERERSMKEEHVDGGYLVTMGTYVGPEDFNKQIVRQLMVCALKAMESTPIKHIPNSYHPSRLSVNLLHFGED